MFFFNFYKLLFKSKGHFYNSLLLCVLRNPLDIDDFDDDDTDEIFDDKDKDVKLLNKYNLQAGPV